MTNTAAKLAHTEAPVFTQTMRTWTLTPQSLRELILFQRERLDPDMMQIIPLTGEFRTVLLDHCHFLSRRARAVLLLRLAGARVFDEPLLTELCAHVSRTTRLEGLQRARRAGNRAAAWVIEESLDGDAPPERPEPLLRRLLLRFCGLAC